MIYIIRFSLIKDVLVISVLSSIFIVNLVQIIKENFNLPVNESGINDYGLKGQFAVSDGNGGITWMTVIDGNEVGY